LSAQNAAEIRVRASRRIGEISEKLPHAPQAGRPRGNVAERSKDQTLRAAKIDPRDARRWGIGADGL